MDGTRRGRIECGELAPALVFERALDAPVELVWKTLTTSQQTERWIGGWTGHGAPGGTVQLTWNAEEGAPTESIRVLACDPPHKLSLSSGHDPDFPYLITIELVQHDGGTTLEFRQLMWGEATPAVVGAGWEFYLDRLEQVISGFGEVPVWDDRYKNLHSHYEELQAAMALCLGGGEA